LKLTVVEHTVFITQINDMNEPELNIKTLPVMQKYYFSQTSHGY